MIQKSLELVCGMGLKSLGMPASEALECYKPWLMCNTGQSSAHQDADRNEDNKGRDHGVLAGNHWKFDQRLCVLHSVKK